MSSLVTGLAGVVFLVVIAALWSVNVIGEKRTERRERRAAKVLAEAIQAQRI